MDKKTYIFLLFQLDLVDDGVVAIFQPDDAVRVGQAEEIPLSNLLSLYDANTKKFRQLKRCKLIRCGGKLKKLRKGHIARTTDQK